MNDIEFEKVVEDSRFKRAIEDARDEGFKEGYKKARKHNDTSDTIATIVALAWIGLTAFLGAGASAALVIYIFI